LLATGDAVEFASKADSKGYSPLAEALFDFPFVQKVFIAANFITITKTDNVPWDFINMELREFIREWMSFGKEILIQMPTQLAQMEDDSNAAQPTKSFNRSSIKSLLLSYISSITLVLCFNSHFVPSNVIAYLSLMLFMYTFKFSGNMSL
jgi:hypothetical protein